MITLEHCKKILEAYKKYGKLDMSDRKFFKLVKRAVKESFLTERDSKIIEDDILLRISLEKKFVDGVFINVTPEPKRSFMLDASAIILDME